VAAARYGAMSWALPSEPLPVERDEDMRTRVIRELLEARDAPRRLVRGVDDIV
jgi:hypothetical protein